MGVVQRFEQRLGGLVEGAFARVFKGEVQPVELAKALERETDARRTVVGADRTLTVNVFSIALGDRDFQRLDEWSAPLTRELAEMVREHAAAERYSFVGPVTVELVHDPSVATGTFRVDAAIQAPEGAAASASASSAPAGGQRQPASSYPNIDPAPSLGIAHPPPASGRPRLQDPNGGEHPIKKPVTTLGRGGDADVRIDDSGASRRHAQLIVNEDDIEIADLGSTNGTRVNGTNVTRARLIDGDRITLGQTTLTFRRDRG